MANQWFRMYNEVVNDPKVQTLPDRLFKAWVNLLCIASDGDGVIRRREVAFKLRISESRVDALLKELELFFEEVNEGELEPHNWHIRQFQSDVSTERVKLFRERQRNVSSRVTGTPSEQSRADTEQSRTDICAGVRDRECWFKEFWAVAWAKIGRDAALDVWLKKVKTREDADRLIAAAREQGPGIMQDAAERASREGGRPRPLHPRTWLHQGRDADEVPMFPTVEHPNGNGAKPSRLEQIMRQV